MQSLPRIRFALVLSLFAACGEEATTDGGIAQGADALSTYARVVEATYADALQATRALDTAVVGFVEAPTAERLEAARQAWLAAREPYLQSEVFRFYDGPIDNPEDGPEGLINAWPLDEAYIDAVEGDPSAGLVNDLEKPIDEAALVAANEAGGEENIATGFHAVEFLLWGQDQSEDGPGGRPHTDFLTTPEATAPNGERRGQYLRTASALLVEHLEGLVAAWSAGEESNYRASFEAVEVSEGLRRVLTGMIVLSGFETGGERLQTALDSGSQEDEHSCFSDNTHRDMVQDIQGVLNVWQGRYVRTDGTTVEGVGVDAAVRARDADLATRLDAALADSLTKANALMPPFDREIAPENTAGRARVQALVVALRQQESTLQEVFRLFDLSVPVVE